MHKIWLIIKREYLTRVRKRTFIIGTLLFPILYMALIFGTGYIAEKTRQNLHVAIIDSSGYFTEALLAKQNVIDNTSTLTLVKNDMPGKEFNYDSAGFDAERRNYPISFEKYMSLGFKPQISLEAGIQEIISFYRQSVGAAKTEKELSYAA